MAVLLQAAYEMNARCANPWPKETFSPGASESRITPSSLAFEAPAAFSCPIIALSSSMMVSVGSLWILVRDVGTLSQAPAERDVLARSLVERDQEIIWRNSGSRGHAIVQGLQQSQSLLLGTAGDEGDLQDN